MGHGISMHVRGGPITDCYKSL